MQNLDIESTDGYPIEYFYNSGYLPVHTVGAAPAFLIDLNNEYFQQTSLDPKEYIDFVAKTGYEIKGTDNKDLNSKEKIQTTLAYKKYMEKVGIYRKDNLLSKKASRDLYVHISHFFPVLKTANKGRCTFTPTTAERKNEKNLAKKVWIRAQNSPILRLAMTGSKTGMVKCPFSGIDLVDVKFCGNVYRIGDLHHMKYINGNSEEKTDKKQPSDLYEQVDLSRYNARSLSFLLELLGTVPVSKDSHNLIHQATKYGDIVQYPIAWLPWAIQSESNYNQFAEIMHRDYNYDLTQFPNYFKYIENLMLSPELRSKKAFDFGPSELPRFNYWDQNTTVTFGN